MKAVVGIDIGSSSIKAVLFDLDGMKVLHTVRLPLQSRIVNSKPDHFEEDPNIIRAQVFEIIATLEQEARSSGIAILSIAFTGQMHGGLLVDEALNPLTPFITWQDKRGDEISSTGKSYVEKLTALIPLDTTGVGIKTGFLITTWYWFLRNKCIPNSATKLLGIYDWLTSVLINKAVTDISSAAAWGVYDPVKRTWREEYLHAAKLPTSFLPDVVEPAADLGTIDTTIAKRLHLDPTIHVHASIGDTQAAYLGSECKTDEVLLNVGTGSQSMWETSNPVATEGTDIRYLGQGRFLACAPTLAGGEAYRIVADFFRETIQKFTNTDISISDCFRIMDRLAVEAHSEGMTLDPIFQGSKFRDTADRGSIRGIDRINFHPSNVVKALVEGMIEEMARPYFLRGEFGHRGIVGEGGALHRNAALRQAAEVRFQLPLRMGRFEEAAAVGAALLCKP